MNSLISRTAMILASASLLIGTSAAAQPSPTPQAQAPSAWMMLSVLGPSRAVALGGASATAQPREVPPPPPPGAYAAGNAGVHVTAELFPVLLWFGLIALALTNSGSSNARPNTPA